MIDQSKTPELYDCLNNKALNESEIGRYLKQRPNWQLTKDGKKIRKKYNFTNFTQSWQFADKVDGLAETEGHHPDITFGWGHCKIELHTHEINALGEKDFLLVAKIDNLI